MAPRRPYLIAVAGCSCSGKSELARALSAALPAPVLPLDAYYRELNGLSSEQRALINFDEPAAIDTFLLFDHVERLARGEPVARPVYDFATHSRSPLQQRLQPSEFLILEGLFALYWERIRALCQTRVFIELDHNACLERRLRRDVLERGRTPESVRRQFEETVRPMAEIYVLPTRAFADVIVSGKDPLPQSVARVRWHIQTVCAGS